MIFEDTPNKHMAMFHSYIKSPEGKFHFDEVLSFRAAFGSSRLLVEKLMGPTDDWVLKIEAGTPLSV